MRILHSHDPTPDRPVTVDEMKSTITRLHKEMWEYAASGDFLLAQLREQAIDRVLLALHARLNPEGNA